MSRKALRWLRGHVPELCVGAGLAAAGVVVGLVLARHGGSGGGATTTQALPQPPPVTAAPAPSPPATTPPPAPGTGALQVTSVTPFGATIAWQTSRPASPRVSYGVAGLGATRWLPAGPSGTSHVATLTGLAPGTAYHVDVSPGADGSQQASLDLTTQPLPAAPVAATADGWVRLDGAPWFPFIEYGACSTLYDSFLETGIDLFAANPCGGLEPQTAALAGRALAAAAVGDDPASAAGVVGTFYPDEADASGYTAALLPSLPPGLRFLTLSNHVYSGAAQLPDGGVAYPGLVAKSDVVGFDLYPLQGWCRADRLVDVYPAQREVVALAAGRPTFQWIEAAGMNCPTDPAVAITPATVRAESWLAIAAGAHGLGFFPAAWTADVARAITSVKAEVAAVLPVLGGGTALRVSAGTSRVVSAAWALDGALYVVAVNTTATAVDASITVPGLGARTASVLGEQRSLAATGGALRDSFAPLAVHVYVVAP